jgi:hypothetical protein
MYSSSVTEGDEPCDVHNKLMQSLKRTRQHKTSQKNCRLAWREGEVVRLPIFGAVLVDCTMETRDHRRHRHGHGDHGLSFSFLMLGLLLFCCRSLDIDEH